MTSPAIALDIDAQILPTTPQPDLWSLLEAVQVLSFGPSELCSQGNFDFSPSCFGHCAYQKDLPSSRNCSPRNPSLRNKALVDVLIG